MAGMNTFSEKESRKRRRQYHVARDLRTPKYKQRVVPVKKARPAPIDDYEDYE